MKLVTYMVLKWTSKFILVKTVDAQWSECSFSNLYVKLPRFTSNLTS